MDGKVSIFCGQTKRPVIQKGTLIAYLYGTYTLVAFHHFKCHVVLNVIASTSKCSPYILSIFLLWVMILMTNISHSEFRLLTCTKLPPPVVLSHCNGRINFKAIAVHHIVKLHKSAGK